jgi:hypothetical protein
VIRKSLVCYLGSCLVAAVAYAGDPATRPTAREKMPDLKPATAAGGEHGNGGDVIACQDADGFLASVELRDYFEAREMFGRKIILQPDDADEFAAAAALLHRLDRLNPLRSRSFLAALAEVKANQVFLDQAHIVDVQDEHPAIYAPGCQKWQAAVRVAKTGGYLFYFDQNVWRLLSKTQRVGLLVHEALHVEFYDTPNHDSSETRRFNGLLADANVALETMDVRSYADALAGIQVTWFEFKGWPFLISGTTFAGGGASGLLADVAFDIPLQNAPGAALRTKGGHVTTFEPSARGDDPLDADFLAFMRRVTVDAAGKPQSALLVAPEVAAPYSCELPVYDPATTDTAFVIGGEVFPQNAKCKIVVSDGLARNATLGTSFSARAPQVLPTFRLVGDFFDMTPDPRELLIQFNAVPGAGEPQICAGCAGTVRVAGLAFANDPADSAIFSPADDAIGFRLLAAPGNSRARLPGGLSVGLLPGPVLLDGEVFLVKATTDELVPVTLPAIFGDRPVKMSGSLHFVYGEGHWLKGFELTLAEDAPLKNQSATIHAGCTISGLFSRPPASGASVTPTVVCP